MKMASSSIEVMGIGGDDMKVMLMDEGPHDEEMAKKMHDIINSTGTIGHIIDTGPKLSEPAAPGHDDEFASINQFSSIGGMIPPPGTIIFSPQDLMRNSKPPTRGRGRGRGTTIKQDPATTDQISACNQALEVPVACEICHKVMMTGKTLIQHMAIHSDMKPFQCPHCPKSFARKVHLQGHLVIHGIEKQFECPVCHQRFSRQDCVKVHMRLHDKSKCVYCDVCHKAFLTVGALNIHLRIHRGEKPFKCHLCSKCFTQKNHLITHIKRHTKVTDEHFTKKLGPRMFKCEHCTRAFIRLSDYERHVQWNHGAVAEGSIIDKLPTVSNLIDGEMKQTGFAPQVFKAPRDAINSRRVKAKRGKKVMCSASTQTDEAGGHVIIPRMYQGQVSASTQVSAPPTPRPADDDMYENDIFDEGMDRNYSSDEDEDDPSEMKSPEESKLFTVTGTSDMASDPVQDAAFDAIVQGAHLKPVSETKEPVLEEAGSTNDEHAIFLQEVVSSMTKQGLDVREPEPENEDNSSQEEETRMQIIEEEARDKPPEESAEELTTVNPEELEEESQDDLETDRRLYGDTKSGFHFSTPLARGRGRGKTRGRGRGSRGKKYSFGLTGAAELRFIRKSMMMSILNATAEGKEGGNEMGNVEETEAMDTEESKGMATADDVETEGRVKRMAKKQHGKDFVCNMKNCETCLPSPKPNSKLQTKVKVKLKEKDAENTETIPAKKILRVPDGQGNTVVSLAKPSVFSVKKSPKPLIKSSEKPWFNQESQLELQKLKDRLANSSDVQKIKQESHLKKAENEEPKMKVVNRVGTYPVDITANPLGNKSQTKQDFFVATSKADSIVSPPVELMSFCIPTYSCKLCGREFRFEGKLHRHIESVHQNKVIFSADVKPGRGSSKCAIPRVTKIDELPMPQPEVEAENPEIAALRSEWDDDDDDEEDSIPGSSNSVSKAPTTIPSVTTYTPHTPITIVTRDITPMTTTVSGSLYSSGVKLNMNKLAGLLPQNKDNPVVSSNMQVKQDTNTRVTSSVAPSHHPREPETIMADTLDMKCRRLLEKLFNHDLLLSCGLLEEHVSVVLGKVLQHYGVKMIEDYGQGQYEVLKYNLWRLIEWKVTMEQMEEFYTAGKSVEEMMDDIMNERVPLVSHHFVPHEQKAHPPPQVSQAGQVTQVETMEVTEGQMVLQQVAGVLGGQLNLPEGVTQVVLAQDVSPDLLQGAHIVTIDPTTGQVISQVTADQVILTDAIGDELEQQVAALDGQVVVSQAHITDQSGAQESIVVQQSSTISVHGSQGPVSHGQVVVHAAPHQQSIKLETASHTSAQQHHPHHQQ
ncbi:uncharacterized protein LOC135207498 isoform X1 [Macrobrachium nipponense]|uniref:uncharacterized protein LOC135207498 isoform X1 n=2 Tax=Macrobrachium nipponense TaxID=159736 RepID=UPI0030C7C642